MIDISTFIDWQLLWIDLKNKEFFGRMNSTIAAEEKCKSLFPVVNVGRA
jgi:hypothetical protein